MFHLPKHSTEVGLPYMDNIALLWRRWTYSSFKQMISWLISRFLLVHYWPPLPLFFLLKWDNKLLECKCSSSICLPLCTYLWNDIWMHSDLNSTSLFAGEGYREDIIWSWWYKWCAWNRYCNSSVTSLCCFSTAIQISHTLAPDFIIFVVEYRSKVKWISFHWRKLASAIVLVFLVVHRERFPLKNYHPLKRFALIKNSLEPAETFLCKQLSWVSFPV